MGPFFKVHPLHTGAMKQEKCSRGRWNKENNLWWPATWKVERKSHAFVIGKLAKPACFRKVQTSKYATHLVKKLG